jgi:cysteine desulfurase/selenocysteine lyase
MTTSNSEPISLAQLGFTQNELLPDIEQLTKMANDLFSALPCDGSRFGQVKSTIMSGVDSSLPGFDKSNLPSITGFGLPGEAELQTFHTQSLASSYKDVPNSLDTEPVFDKPSTSTASSLAGFDKSILSGILPNDFGLPDEAQLQQLLVSRVPSGDSLPQFGIVTADTNPATGVFQPSVSPKVSEAELYKFFEGKTPSTERIPKSVAGVKDFSNSSSFDAKLIAGLSPEVYGLPGESELQSLFSPNGLTASSVDSGSSFYFVDELKAVGYKAQLPVISSAHPPFDVHAIRRDFPILKERVNGHPLVWFDNAATTQKPQVVIDRISHFYEHENSNIHRAAHELAARSTDAYEKARDTVAHFMNAPSSAEIVFVRGTTEAINLVAQSWGRQHISLGDEIVITWLEHHANIVPWKQLCELTGATLRVAPVDEDGQILLGEYQKLLNANTKLVAFTQVSNALGTVTPAKEMIDMAHRVGARVLLDGAQSVSHLRVDVQALDCDWFVFSGHKIFGPTGIGVLYGKSELLESMPPWQGGGNMIEDVTFEKIIYQPAPARFEAGTGNIADAVGLGAALEYLLKIGIDNIARYEHELLIYAMEALRSISGLRLIGTAAEKTSVLSFVLAGHSNQEVGIALNRVGIAVRTGHHCAQPILRRYGLESTVRPSLAFYNTHQEVDLLVNTVRRIKSGRDF